MDKTVLDKEQKVILINNQPLSQEVIHEHGSHANVPVVQTPTFWSGVAFVLVVLALYCPIKAMIKAMFDKKKLLIASNIKEASELKEEARELFANYAKKLESIEEDTKAILLQSKKDIALLKKQSLAEIEQRNNAKIKDAEAEINYAKAKTKDEMYDLLRTKTIQVLKKIIFEKMSKENKQKLIDNSIDVISKIEPF